MSDFIKARKELTEMGILEEARDKSGDIVRRNGEIVWRLVPNERLTEEQKAYLELLDSDAELN
jgi:hypothetical protein